MTKSTLLLMSAFILSSGIVSAQQRFTKKSIKKDKTEEVYTHPRLKSAIPSVKSFASAEEANCVWKPKKETFFEYDPESEGWEEYAVATYEYDDNANTLVAVFNDGESKSQTILKYDKYNNVIENISQAWEGEQWVNQERSVYTYDDVVTDYQISSDKYNWDSQKGQWNNTYSHKKEITRNDLGYVTSLSIKMLYGGEYEELERTEITYDKGGSLPAQSWEHYSLNYDLEFKKDTKFDKMAWESCDGQILATSEEFMIGNNRLKSAKIYDYEDDGTYTSNYKAEYPNSSKRDFKVTLSPTEGPQKIEHILTELDENGSYKEEYIETLDEDGDGVMEVYDSYMLAIYDENKNPVKEEMYEVVDGMEEQTDGQSMEYQYGEHNEILETVNSMWNYDEGVYEPVEKIVASEFTEIVTAIENNYVQGNLNYQLENGNISFSMDGMKQYAIFNANGTKVAGEQTNADNATVSTITLLQGLYILVVSGQNQTASVKFLRK